MVSRCWPNAGKATIRGFSRSRMYLEGGEGWSEGGPAFAGETALR